MQPKTLIWAVAFLIFVQAGLGNEKASIKTLRQDIQLLNLINELGLDDDQMEFILQRAVEAERLRTAYLQKTKALQDDIVPVFTQQRRNLLSNRPSDQTLRRQVHECSHDLLQLRREYQSELTSLAEEIESVLHSHQIFSLEEYLPCLIPPQGSSRIGQESNQKGVERLLDKIRRLPAPVFQKRKSDIAEKTLQRIRLHLPKGYELDESAEIAFIADILERAYSLDDIDYTVKKQELAQSVDQRYALPEIPRDIAVKIERFLLQPQIVPLLQEKINYGKASF